MDIAHHPVVTLLTQALELMGVAVILLGAAWATGAFVWTLALRRRAFDQAWRSYRANLGRGILLGLELLVGADIIATVTAPLTYQSVGLLAIVVLIRTFLSFALETEIEGRWPWRRAEAERERTTAS